MFKYGKHKNERTYGKKKKKTNNKPEKKTNNKPENETNNKPDTQPIQINVTKHVTNFHFHFSAGNSASSEDDFDKLFKGPFYQQFQNLSTQRNNFFQRQDSATLYNSNATTTTFSSSSSVGLFKDTTHHSYSDFDSPESPRKNRKKTESKKKNNKVEKKKKKRLSVSQEFKCLAKATSSTPTHPCMKIPKSQWPIHVSPIMPVSSQPPLALDFHSRNSVDLFEENLDEGVKNPKAESNNLSELAAGFLKLDIKDRNSSRKALSIVTPSEENIKNNQSCDSAKSKKTLFPSLVCVQNKPESLRSSFKSSIEDDGDSFGNNNQVKRENDKSIENISRDLISHIADESSFNFPELNKISARCSKSRSRRQVSNKVLNLEGYERGQSQCDNVDSKLEESENIPHSFGEVTSEINSKGLQVIYKDDQFKLQESLHQLSPCNNVSNAEESTSTVGLQDIYKDEQFKEPLHQLSPCNTVSSAVTSTSAVTSGQWKPALKSQNSTNCRMSLMPGKAWRRSYLQQKRTGDVRKTIGPEILSRLAQDANLSCSRLSCVDDSRSILTVNDSFLRRVSLRHRNERKTKVFYTDYCEVSSTEKEELILEQSGITSLGFGVDQASANTGFQPSLAYSKVTNKNLLKNRIILKSFKQIPNMGNILEESLEETCEVSEAKAETHSPLYEPKEADIGDSSTQQAIEQESVCETPPIMKVNPEILSTISRRNWPQQRREFVNISSDSVNLSLSVLNASTSSQFAPSKSTEEEFASYTNVTTPNRSQVIFHESSDSESCASSSIDSPNKEMTFLTANDEEEFKSFRDDEEDIKTVFTSKEGFLLRCGVSSPLHFEEVFTEESLKCCKKIGEGVYGEVFMFDHKNEKTVVKIIPIEGSKNINGAVQKKFEEVLSELITTEELSLLRDHKENSTSGFCLLKRKLYLSGSYPTKLLELWHDYDEKHKSYNECPDKLDEDNCFLALELEHAGDPVENFPFSSPQQAYSVFLQVCYSLAAAEKALDFEHRDLHIGNILVKQTKDTHVIITVNNEEIKLPSYGLKATIIDFTLSRMSFMGSTIYLDLAKDPELFTSTGDYQFEIYRLMRTDLDDQWERFQPKTNLRWLRYLLDKMLTATKYKSKKNTKVHKAYIKKLEKVMGYIEDFNSTLELAEQLSISCL